MEKQENPKDEQSKTFTRSLTIPDGFDYVKKLHSQNEFYNHFVAIFGEEPSIHEFRFAEENIKQANRSLPPTWLNKYLPKEFVAIHANHVTYYEPVLRESDRDYFGSNSFAGSNYLWIDFEHKMCIHLDERYRLTATFNIANIKALHFWKKLMADFSACCLHKLYVNDMPF